MKVKKANKKKVFSQNVDIFTLFTKEKIVNFEDNNGRKSSVLIVKLTQGDRTKVLKDYLKILADTKEDLIEQDKKSKYYTKTLDFHNKEQLIEALIAYERPQRAQIIDLYPIEKEDETPSEKIKSNKQESMLEKWEKDYRIDLQKIDEIELRERLRASTLDGLALLESGKRFDFLCLHHMCLHPKTRMKIFSTPGDVERITDASVLDKLIDEINEFRAVDTPASIRNTVDNDDFLASGESQEEQEGSHASATKKS